MQAAAGTRPITIVFTGRFDPAAFIRFAIERAWLLGLETTPLQADERQVGLAVRGQPDMVDAFEAGCSLGPASCLVTDVSRTGAD